MHLRWILFWTCLPILIPFVFSSQLLIPLFQMMLNINIKWWWWWKSISLLILKGSGTSPWNLTFEVVLVNVCLISFLVFSTLNLFNILNIYLSTESYAFKKSTKANTVCLVLRIRKLNFRLFICSTQDLPFLKPAYKDQFVFRIYREVFK